MMIELFDKFVLLFVIYFAIHIGILTFIAATLCQINSILKRKDETK